jgi:hypothetical protein
VIRALAATAAAGLLAAGAAPAGEPQFRASVAAVSPALRAQLVSWRPGCPVGLDDLRVLTLSHWGFDGTVKRGRLMVHEDAARPLVSVFRSLFEARFPIRRMQLVDRYGGDDFRSIEADNTSAFNCRRATGSGSWSLHAYGLAIDLNPLENPYVANGRTSHRRSVPYVDRSPPRRGMVLEGDVVVRAFDRIGWGWGGRWAEPKDYQHFSAAGR